MKKVTIIQKRVYLFWQKTQLEWNDLLFLQRKTKQNVIICVLQIIYKKIVPQLSSRYFYKYMLLIHVVVSVWANFEILWIFFQDKKKKCNILNYIIGKDNMYFSKGKVCSGGTLLVHLLLYLMLFSLSEIRLFFPS